MPGHPRIVSVVALTLAVACGTAPDTPGDGQDPHATVHDHSPRHGGVVREVEGIHVELVASADGRVRAYLSDDRRRPLPARDATGTVRLDLPGGVQELSFTPAGDALEARTDPFTVESTAADAALVAQGKRLEMRVLLDLTGKRAGVPIVPQTGCLTPDPPPAGGRGPRCVVTFGNTFTAIGTAPKGDRVIVAVTHGATTVWRLPDATLVMGVEPLPPSAVTAGAHEPDPARRRHATRRRRARRRGGPPARILRRRDRSLPPAARRSGREPDGARLVGRRQPPAGRVVQRRQGAPPRRARRAGGRGRSPSRGRS